MTGNDWENVWLIKGKTFLESFPNIKSGHAVVIEDGDGTHPGIGSLPWGGRIVSFERSNGQIPCSNPKCTGGVYIEPEVYDMIQKGEDERDFPIGCPGPRCANFFKIKVVLRYKS